MKYEIKTEKTLITDNKKVFREGSDIAFTVVNKITGHLERYIAEIKEISDTNLILRNVEIEGTPVDGEKTIAFNAMVDDSCDYVHLD